MNGESPSALVRYLWPFWLFHDASRGDGYTRAAAYRHNRQMRIHLPGYLLRWLLGSAITFGIAGQLDALSSWHGADVPNVFAMMTAASAMLFVGEICLLLIMGCIYLSLSWRT